MNLSPHYYNGIDLSLRPDGKEMPHLIGELATSRIPLSKLIFASFHSTASVVIASILYQWKSTKYWSIYCQLFIKFIYILISMDSLKPCKLPNRFSSFFKRAMFLWIYNSSHLNFQEMSRIWDFTLLPSNKLACHNFINVKRSKTPGSKM